MDVTWLAERSQLAPLVSTMVTEDCATMFERCAKVDPAWPWCCWLTERPSCGDRCHNISMKPCSARSPPRSSTGGMRSNTSLRRRDVSKSESDACQARAANGDRAR